METNKRRIGMLRQWLNEDRITDIQKMVTNEDIETWLVEPKVKHTENCEYTRHCKWHEENNKHLCHCPKYTKEPIAVCLKCNLEFTTVLSDIDKCPECSGQIAFLDCLPKYPIAQDWDWRKEFREFFDKHLKPKKPTMKNLDRELLVNFIEKVRTQALDEKNVEINFLKGLLTNKVK
jgi:hypothetical protein